MTVCAIHQPNFFPWIGYFDKIKNADVFIFMDEVAYPKSGSGAGSWVNRVQLLNQGNSFWFGMPVKREAGVQWINQVEISQKKHAEKKLIKFLQCNYSKAACYKKYQELIIDLLRYPSSNIAEFNINVIMVIAEILCLPTRTVCQSELTHQATSTELLIELVNAVECDAYMCGNGAGGYQEDKLFVEHGIELVYQEQKLADSYPDIPENELSLSIIHHLLNGYLD